MCLMTCDASHHRCSVLVAEGGSISEPNIILFNDTFSVYVQKQQLERKDISLHLEFFFQPKVRSRRVSEDETTVFEPTYDVPLPDDVPEHKRTKLEAANFALRCRKATGGGTFRLGYVRIPLNDIPKTIRDGESEEEKSKSKETKKSEEKARHDWSSGKVFEISSAASSEWNNSWDESNHCGYAQVTAALYQALPLDAQAIYRVLLDLHKVGISFMDGTPSEVLYVSLLELKLVLEEAKVQRTMELKLGRIQIDDQRPDAHFPIVLAPTAVKPEDIQPCLQVSVNMMKDEKIPVMMFRYASVLLQKMDIMVAEEFIYFVLGYVNSLVVGFTVTEKRKDKDLDDMMFMNADKALEVPKTTDEEKPLYLFFELLQLQPIALNLSFAAAPTHGKSPFESTSTTGFIRSLLTTVLNVIGSIAGSLDSVPLRLTGKQFHYASGTLQTVMRPIAMHYIHEGTREAYKVIGSFDFLGNPVGLASNIGEGAKEFFFEPAQGLVAGPTAFTKGLAKGSLSLVNNTVKGVFGAASKITGSVGKGVAALSMDDKYIASRAKAQGKPQNPIQALHLGGQSLLIGIKSGVTGVVREPAEGLKKEGPIGFGKGVAKGIFGVAAKPTVGVADLASLTILGIGNTVEYLTGSKQENRKMRPRRAIKEGRLEVYDFMATDADEKEKDRAKKYCDTLTSKLHEKEDQSQSIK
eukprot:TRINITY_DN1669_c0_g2_i9.p1 TRINITY_DN1669_c0_g2~~TRINITY_DN1669_c0_g2_i9.p1  ORF type:complete len:694 (-),score=85.21 TRINITY_DN1669_c0_g2_i9:33-2114(-)